MNTFREAARSKDFVLSTELFLRPESSSATIGEQVRLVRQHVDGILVTDNQEGKIHLDPLAAAALVQQHGGDPVMQLACRNRNRIALLGELLGAATLGVSSLMLIRGNRVPDGFHPRPKAVFDVDAAELIAIANTLKADEALPSPPDFFIGSVVTPHAPAPGWHPEKLIRKADAGVQFVLTQLCMDVPLLREYMKHLVAAGMPRRLSVFVTLSIPATVDDARHLVASNPRNRIPDEIIARLGAARDSEQEAIAICGEMLRELKEIPGVGGAHLVATRNLAAVNAAVDAAGMAAQAILSGGT